MSERKVLTRKITKAMLKKQKKGTKSYLREKEWAENFLKDEDVLKSKKEKGKVAFRLDARTVVYIPADASDEYKDGLKKRYSVDGHVEQVMEKFKI